MQSHSLVSIPKRVSEALNPLRDRGFKESGIVSIPKRVSEALNQIAFLVHHHQKRYVSIPKRVSEALNPLFLQMSYPR